MSRFKRAAILGIFTGAMGFLAVTPWGESLEERLGLAWMFRIRGSIEPPPEVVVVDIDRDSPNYLGLTKRVSTWPRHLHARVIDVLVQQGAAVIAMDLFFGEPRTPEEDSALKEAISRAKRVILFQNAKFKTETIGGHRVSTVQLIPPFEPLADAASGLAPFPLPKTPGGVRQFWAFFTAGAGVPTLPAVALQLYAASVSDRAAPDRTIDALLQQQGCANGGAHGAMLCIRQRFQSEPQRAQQLIDTLRTERANTPSSREIDALMALVGLYAGEDSRYLNYYGPPGTIRTIPYHVLLSHADDENRQLDLAGRVVFLGASELTTAEQSDSYYTIFTGEDGVDISGVEFAATAFANLLTDRTIRPAGYWLWLGVPLVFGGAAGVLVYLLSGVRAVVATVALGAILFLLGQVLFLENRWVPVIVPALVQLPMALLVGLLIQYVSSRRAIRHFVPESEARRIDREGRPLAAPELTYGVCLSTDAEDYTRLSEVMEPKELAELMNEYYGALGEPVSQNGGVVSDYTGDSMMSYWLAPGTESEARSRACLAALGVIDSVERFNDHHPDKRLPTRIGLHVGEVALGSLGGSGHFAYHVVGDVANTASRIERLNKRLGTNILASEAVVEGLDLLLLRPVGDFKLVGKSRALSIVEVRIRRDVAAEWERELCKRFAIALSVYQAEQWSRAADQFEAIVTDYPADGPARFYLARCRQEPRRVIEVETK